MEINDLIKVLEEELDDVAAGSVDGNTAFRQLDGWSSMTALILIARIDGDFGITLSAQELGKAITVDDLYQVLKSKN